MKRTWKWQQVSEEAQRLAALGVSAPDIAQQLGVNASTVTRWLASGRLTRDGGLPAPPRRPAAATPDQRPTTDWLVPASSGPRLVAAPLVPATWAEAVRAVYTLDVTDQELVALAEVALEAARDRTAATNVRMTAIGRFQAIVKQLARTLRPAVAAEAEAAPVAAPVPSARQDPRGKWLLQ